MPFRRRHPDRRASRRRSAARYSRRKLLPPEALEPRNAPSSTLPLLGDLLAAADANHAEEGSGAAATQIERESPRAGSNGGRADAALELAWLGLQNMRSRGARASDSTGMSSNPTPQVKSGASDDFFSLLGVAPLAQPLAPKLTSLEARPAARDQVQPAPLPSSQAAPTPTAVRASSAGGGAAVSKIGGGASGSGSKSPLVTSAANTSSTIATPQPANLAAVASTSLAGTVTPAAKVAAIQPLVSSSMVIEESEVELLLQRAAAATARNDAIIAIVDRAGQILGVRVEAGVKQMIADDATLVFAIDGAVAKARTAAFFSSDSAPLTSRTVRFISQSTIIQREVESNPNIDDKGSTIRGPGFVAPIGLGGHFPPGVMLTPQVDLFAIEHTNRDGFTHPGRDGVKGTGDDVALGSRFGADFAAGKEVLAPESYGTVSGLLPDAQSRGIATLPGGVPLYKYDAASPTKQRLVGGIGVFFPGPDGYATFEQNFQHSSVRTAAGLKPQTAQDRVNASLVLEAEYTAAVVALNNTTIAGIPPLSGYVFNAVRIDLAGITLEAIGPHPNGVKGLLAMGKSFGVGDPNGGMNMPVDGVGDTLLTGTTPPDGWLVEPRAAADGSITAAEVRKIIEDGVAEANRVRAQIRELGSRTRMVLSVADKEGNILGLYRMPDATVFSIDVAVAKARNVAYYADPNDVERVDRVDANFDGNPDVAAGAAFTNRTFRYLSTPFFPTGVDSQPSGPFSTLNEPGINPLTAENIGGPKPANQFNTVLGYDAFNPGTNFRELNDLNAVAGNQNGVVFFPGSTPLYKNGQLVGGLGVSGDGVDQDDVVTFGAAGNYLPSLSLPIQRADEVFVRGVRLPFIKFSRNPHA